MAGPWEKYGGGSNVVASSAPIPKAATGYRPGATLQIDPGYMSGEVGLAGAKAAASASAAATKEKDVAAFRANLERSLMKERIAAELDKARRVKQIGTGPTAEKVSALDSLSRQLEDVRGLYNKNFKGGNAITSLMEFLPTPAAQQFNSAAAGLSDQALAAFRVPGVGSQSDAELRSFIMANQPKNTDYDAAIEQKIKNIEGRLLARRRALGLPDRAPPLTGGKPKANSNDGWKVERID